MSPSATRCRWISIRRSTRTQRTSPWRWNARLRPARSRRSALRRCCSETTNPSGRPDETGSDLSTEYPGVDFPAARDERSDDRRRLRRPATRGGTEPRGDPRHADHWQRGPVQCVLAEAESDDPPARRRRSGSGLRRPHGDGQAGAAQLVGGRHHALRSLGSDRHDSGCPRRRPARCRSTRWISSRIAFAPLGRAGWDSLWLTRTRRSSVTESPRLRAIGGIGGVRRSSPTPKGHINCGGCGSMWSTTPPAREARGALSALRTSSSMPCSAPGARLPWPRSSQRLEAPRGPLAPRCGSIGVARSPAPSRSAGASTRASSRPRVSRWRIRVGRVELLEALARRPAGAQEIGLTCGGSVEVLVEIVGAGSAAREAYAVAARGDRAVGDGPSWRYSSMTRRAAS